MMKLKDKIVQHQRVVPHHSIETNERNQGIMQLEGSKVIVDEQRYDGNGLSSHVEDLKKTYKLRRPIEGSS